MRKLMGGCIAVLVVAMSTGSGVAESAAAALYGPACEFEAILYFSGFKGVDAWIIPPETALETGEWCQTGKTRLIMQHDGNLVVYDEDGRPRWASGTWGPLRISRAVMQDDGNFVVYDSSGPRWESNTCCVDRRYVLAVQSDGNVVIYDRGIYHGGPSEDPNLWTPVWATNTSH